MLTLYKIAELDETHSVRGPPAASGASAEGAGGGGGCGLGFRV